MEKEAVLFKNVKNTTNSFVIKRTTYIIDKFLQMEKHKWQIHTEFVSVRV